MNGRAEPGQDKEQRRSPRVYSEQEDVMSEQAAALESPMREYPIVPHAPGGTLLDFAFEIKDSISELVSALARRVQQQYEAELGRFEAVLEHQRWSTLTTYVFLGSILAGAGVMAWYGKINENLLYLIVGYVLGNIQHYIRLHTTEPYRPSRGDSEPHS